MASTPASADGNSARRDFLSYALSLMRSHNDEHADSLPVIDISALKHSAYVFDALIYYMRTVPESDVDTLKDGISVISWQDGEENENDEQDDDMVTTSITMDTESLEGESECALSGGGGAKVGRKHPFFQRSDSTIFLGCPPPDAFHTPLVEALPLADQPHLLQPNSRREDLFGMARPTVFSRSVSAVEARDGAESSRAGSPFQKLPLNLSLTTRVEDNRTELVRGFHSALYQGLQNRIRTHAEPLAQRLELPLGPQSTAINLSLSATGSPSRSRDANHLLSQALSGSPGPLPNLDPLPETVATGPVEEDTSSSGVIVEMSSSLAVPQGGTGREMLRPIIPVSMEVSGGQRMSLDAGRSDISQPSVIMHTASSLPTQTTASKSFSP